MSALHGLLLIDKPPGVTSHEVVAEVRRILNTREVGHCGTLDPMATGLMILAVGEGLKLVSILTEGDKRYEGEIQFGISTDTLDITGNVTETGEVPKSERDIVEAAQALIGVYELPVPKFSAIKVQGQRLHEKARKGEDFEPPLRQMKFFDLIPGSFNGEKWTFVFSCSKGSFVRSWVLALCQKLGFPGTLSSLRRIFSSPYSLSQAISLTNLDCELKTNGIDQLKKKPCFVSLEKAIPDWDVIRAYRYDLHLLRNGQISKNLRHQLIHQYQPNREFRGFKVLAENTPHVVALIGLELGSGFYIKRVFQHFENQ